jgi:hypothetical protein
MLAHPRSAIPMAHAITAKNAWTDPTVPGDETSRWPGGAGNRGTVARTAKANIMALRGISPDRLTLIIAANPRDLRTGAGIARRSGNHSARSAPIP